MDLLQGEVNMLKGMEMARQNLTSAYFFSSPLSDFHLLD